jgi:hypothetical protein
MREGVASWAAAVACNTLIRPRSGSAQVRSAPSPALPDPRRSGSTSARCSVPCTLTLFVGCDARQSALPVTEFDQAIARVREVSLPHLNSRETNRTTVRVGTPPTDAARMLANPSAPAWSSRQHGPLQTAEGRWRPGAKRAEDLVLGTALLVLVLPLMVAIAVAIRIDTPGPALFRQTRRGLNNPPAWAQQSPFDIPEVPHDGLRAGPRAGGAAGPTPRSACDAGI